MWSQSRRRRFREEVRRRLCCIEQTLSEVKNAVVATRREQEEQAMTNAEAVEQLAARVAGITTVVGSVKAVVTGMAGRIEELAGEINSQPGGTQFAEKLLALSAELTAGQDQLAAAVEAGTGALGGGAPTPPEQPPTE